MDHETCVQEDASWRVSADVETPVSQGFVIHLSVNKTVELKQQHKCYYHRTQSFGPSKEHRQHPRALLLAIQLLLARERG
jgi:hypothetical protein